MKDPIKYTETECPNCWGHFEYDENYREPVQDEQIDVNNHSFVRSFIKEFVVTHIDGVHLKREDDELVCPHIDSYSALIHHV